jgi:hypothetical protein
MGTPETATTEQTYRAIGRFIFEFSQFEYTMKNCVAEAIDLGDEYFNAVTGTWDVGVLCTLAKEVFSKREPDERRRIEKAINRFFEINARRIAVAHGLWVPFKNGGTVHHGPRGKLEPKVSGNQAEELERLAGEMAALRCEFENAVYAFDVRRG